MAARRFIASATILGAALALDPPGVTCPGAPPALPPVALQGCAGVATPTFTTDDNNRSVPSLVPTGNFATRYGCPFRVAGLDSNVKEIYLGINRTLPGSRFKLVWNWDHGFPSGAPILLFGYNRVPTYLPALYQYYYEDYYWSSRVNSEFEWQPNVNTYKDAYHCRGAYCAGNGRYSSTRSYCGQARTAAGLSMRTCTGGLPTQENMGFYYFSVSGAFIGAGETISGALTASFAMPPTAILPAQLNAIIDLWNTNCWPTLQNIPVFNRFPNGTSPNHYWTRANHYAGKYSDYNPDNSYLHREDYATGGSETDSDVVPYCDWMFEADPTGAMMPAQYTYNKVNTQLTISSCLDIPFIACAPTGDVIELRLASRGLMGALPSSFASLTKLKYISLSFNKLSGVLPPFIWASGDLENLFLTKNNFTGQIPCPSHAEPKFKSLYIAKNGFTGTLPECLFSTLVRLQGMDISYNKLTPPTAYALPPSFKNLGTTFVNFFAEHSGLSGPMPMEIGCMKMVIYFHLGRNAITSFPQEALDVMPTLYSLDLSYNKLSGTVPRFDNNTELRRLYLEHNMFSGAFTDQLTAFAASQDQGALSAAHLSYNSLSGPLPYVFYYLKTNAHRLTTVDIAGNHFRCEGTGRWPTWAMRLATDDFGICSPVPKITSVGPPEAIVPGGLMYIYGTDFAASAELKCKIGTLPPTPASFISPTTVTCVLPSDSSVSRGNSYEVTVANYGTDFYSAVTHPADYSEVACTIAYYSPPAPPPLNITVYNNVTVDTLDAGTIAGIAIAGVLLVTCCFVFFCFIVFKEKKGEPIFREITPAAAPNVTAKPGAGAVSTTADVEMEKA